jgi:hypothetical protein
MQWSPAQAVFFIVFRMPLGGLAALITAYLLVEVREMAGILQMIIQVFPNLHLGRLAALITAYLLVEVREMAGILQMITQGFPNLHPGRLAALIAAYLLVEVREMAGILQMITQVFPILHLGRFVRFCIVHERLIVIPTVLKRKSGPEMTFDIGIHSQQL